MTKNTMIKILAPCLLFLTVLQNAQSQRLETRPSWRFYSLNQAGLLNGKKVTAFHLQSVNGFERNNMFAGIGAGLDFDRYKSIPVFAALRKFFGKKEERFFIYTDGGVNFVWEKQNNSINNKESFIPGFYSNTGVGYKAVFAKGTGLLLSAGYSFKRISDRTTETVCLADGACLLQTDTYRYNFNRLIIQIGWMF